MRLDHGGFYALRPSTLTFSDVESSRDMRVLDKLVCAKPNRQCSNLANICGVLVVSSLRDGSKLANNKVVV
jgi:hypothetical protein